MLGIFSVIMYMLHFFVRLNFVKVTL